MIRPILVDGVPTFPSEQGLFPWHAQGARLRQFRRGAILCQPGCVEFVGYVMTGVVKLVTSLPDGRTNIVGLIQAPGFYGRVFGVASEFTIEAATDVMVLCFERGAFDAQLSSNPLLEHFIHIENLYQLDEAHERIIVLACQSIMERLATYMVLRLIAAESCQGDALSVTTVHVPINRRDFAAYLGTTVESVSRSIQALVRRGTIAVNDSANFQVLRRRDLIGLARQSEADLREMISKRVTKPNAQGAPSDVYAQSSMQRENDSHSGLGIAAE